jgi:hypothetical protein
MPTSRAVLILGMHRSGTSAIARGVAALGVYLGNDFLDAQPENPTGYWEDRNLVEIDDRVLRELGLTWDSLELFDPMLLDRFRIRLLRRKARRYCKHALSAAPVWGFKDPRILRILPFWRRVVRDCEAEESYVLAIRNPRSIAASLFARQKMNPDEAYRLWLVHMVPFLSDLIGKPLVVVDYDLFIADPREQLERIARGLALPNQAGALEIERFSSDFVDARLRHSIFSSDALDAAGEDARLTREAYLQLHYLATDRLDSQAPAFWSSWTKLQARLEAVMVAKQKVRR